jgi:hypothetical protein
MALAVRFNDPRCQEVRDEMTVGVIAVSSSMSPGPRCPHPRQRRKRWQRRQPQSTQQCVDPGPCATQVTPPTSKPVEASGAHSPPGMAVTPPSRPEPAAEISPATGAKGG